MQALLAHSQADIYKKYPKIPKISLLKTMQRGNKLICMPKFINKIKMSSLKKLLTKIETGYKNSMPEINKK